MKVYVKKDKVLKLLGEGKVFSKKDLVLREFGGDNNCGSDTITLTNDGEGSDKKTSPNELATDIKKELPKVNAGGKPVQFNVSPDDVAGVTPNTQASQNSTQAPPSVNVSMNDPRLTQLMQQNAKNGYSTNVQNINASVESRKVMDEMRANSIPFTKSELTEFLKSL
jgi:hypothetical protein